MKKIISSVACLLVVASMVPSATFAAPTPLPKAPVKTETVTPPEQKAAPTPSASATALLRAEPLDIRQAIVETQFRELLTRFSAITTRTQTTIDRLSAKNIDTAAAQLSLTAATTALQRAKVSIESFSNINVPTEKLDKATEAALSLSLKESAKKTEDYLKAAREALIESLSALKTSISEKSTLTL